MSVKYMKNKKGEITGLIWDEKDKTTANIIIAGGIITAVIVAGIAYYNINKR